MNEKNINETLQSIEGTLERIEVILLAIMRTKEPTNVQVVGSVSDGVKRAVESAIKRRG